MKNKQSAGSTMISREEEHTLTNTDGKKEPLNPDVIFSNKTLLEDILTRLQKFLRKKLKKRDGRYLCNGDQNLEHRWDKTLDFCDAEGIDIQFVGRLIESLDYPDCEGDLVTDFPVEAVLRKVDHFEKEQQDNN